MNKRKWIKIYLMISFIYICNLSFGQNEKVIYETDKDLFTEFKAICNRMAEIAFENSDTIKLKRTLREIYNNDCGEKYFITILSKTHYHQNVAKNPKDSTLVHLRKRLSNCSVENVITAENVETISNHDELITLILEGIIEYNYKEDIFKRRIYKKFYPPQFHRILRDGMKVSDIGSGASTLAIILSALYPQMKIYSNEIRQELIKYTKHRLDIYESIILRDNIVLILGTKSKTKLPEKVHAIILIETLHHFEEPIEMLKDISDSLVDNGFLIIRESRLTKDANEFRCKKIMKEKDLKKILSKNNFKLIDKNYFGSKMYLSYKKR